MEEVAQIRQETLSGIRTITSATTPLAMVLGMAGMLGRLVNPPLNRWVFDERHGQAWIKHNVEEVGLLEAILPRVLPSAMAARPEAVAACA